MKHSILFLKRMGLAYLLYAVFRLLFWLAHWKEVMVNSLSEVFHAFWVGLLFDSSAIVYTFSLFILLSIIPWNLRNKSWYQILLLMLFLLPASIGSLLSVIDMEFINFTGKRSGLELLYVTTDEGNHWSGYLVDYWYLALLFCLLVFAVYKCYPKLKVSAKTRFGLESIFLLVVLGFCVLGARGGLALKPIKSFAAAKYVKPELVNFTLNTPFNFISTVEGEKMDAVNWMDRESALKIVRPYKSYYMDSEKAPNKPNVVLIILESFGREYVGHLGGPLACTPFLDSLAKSEHCLSVEHFYANGTKSMEAVPSIFSGIPSWMNVPYINSIYQTNQVENMGALLERIGYSTGFFHGSNNGTMGFQNFLSISGMSNYHGIDQYPYTEVDYDGNWGIYDGPYFLHFLDYLNRVKKPTFAGIFTLSSHHPYVIPKELEDKFSIYKNRVQQSVAYTDYALEQFFKRAKTYDWYKNTLFVITADHTSKSKDKYFKGPPGRYEIPCMIVGENFGFEWGMEKIRGSHMDILPTIMDWIDYPDSFYALGNSMFSSPVGYHILFSNGQYWLGDDFGKWISMTMDGELNRYFRLKRGESSKVPLKIDDDARAMHQYLKASVQLYREGVIKNQMKMVRP